MPAPQDGSKPEMVKRIGGVYFVWLFNSQLPRASHADKYAGAALFRVSAPAKQKCTRVLTHCARGNFPARLKLMADWNNRVSVQIFMERVLERAWHPPRGRQQERRRRFAYACDACEPSRALPEMRGASPSQAWRSLRFQTRRNSADLATIQSNSL